MAAFKHRRGAEAPISPPDPEPNPDVERVRPRDPFLRFFQDATMVCGSDKSEDFETESFLDRKADEHNVPPSDIRAVRRIATYVTRTPVALVEVRRPVGVDPEDGAMMEAAMAFVVPAFGEYAEVAREQLEQAGYELRHRSEGETGERSGYAFEHPQTEVVVTLRTYDMMPLAQGPVGFVEAMRILESTLENEAKEYAEQSAGKTDG